MTLPFWKCLVRKTLVGSWPALLVAFALPQAAKATEEYGKAIAFVGASASASYFTLAVPPAGACLFDIIYIDVTTEGGKAQSAIVLTAYSLGKPLSRVVYLKNADGSCWTNLVQF